MIRSEENVRDINAQSDIPMTLGHYLRSMRQLTNQWTPTNFRDERRQRLYLKDIDCPPEWHESLQRIMPPNLFYMNKNVTDRGVQDASNDRDGNVIFRNKAQLAPAGDLMSSLPEEMRAQNLMAYIGHEGTYTAAHREMCASLGQNIMVEASGSEDGEKPGSSIWFMTETNDREVVREYFLSMLGHDIEIEKHFAQINAWKKATFPVYIVEQKPGDFILIPPLAAHQVWNRGTRTMKVAWNRTTVETLEMAMKEALPKARLVCRDEQYKNKAIVYYTLRKYAAELERAEENDETGLLGLEPDLIRTSPRTQQLAADFKRLFKTFSDILTDEMFAAKEKEQPEFIPFDSCITCSYCRGNIFNRFLTCKQCVRPLINGDEDTYDVCMECYAMGRSCLCVARLRWCEQWNWSELVDNYEHWRTMIIKNDGFVDVETSPMPLEIARKRRGKKSLAQVCQEGLKRRPFRDINKPPELEEAQSDSEPEVDDEGCVKKKKRKRKKKKGETRRCHVCCHKDYAYKVHMCSNPNCAEGYCYGVLYRAFDMTPQAVQESEHWLCPKCLGICNCGACRRAGTTKPYTPKSTSLGHDTRPIADDRSVEMLVDFRLHNLSWLKAAGEESRSNSSKRMQRLREQADVAKSQEQANQAAADENAHAATNGYSLNGTLPQPATNGHEPNVEMPSGHVENGGQEGLAGPVLPHDHPVAPLQKSLQEDADSTAYPDPSMNFPQHLIGMGYYEQDDSPDKILFYPYETPTAESVVLDEPDVSEYLKKSIRAAKRKARQANGDDPDFFIRSRPDRKKKRKDHVPEDLELDPALFSTPASGPAADGSATERPADGEGGGDGEQTQEGEYDTGPSLRHARPRHSYAEIEDIDTLDDPDDIVPHWSSGKPKFDTPREKRQEEGSEAAPSPSAGRKRGRPPKRPNAGLFSAPATESPAAPKRRGRPPKSRLSNVISAEDVQPKTDAGGPAEQPAEEEQYGTLDDELRILAKDLEKELSNEYGANGNVAAGGESQEQRRGRLRRSAPDYREAEIRDENEPAEPTQKRGRGRPRRSAATYHQEETSGGEEAEDRPATKKRGPGRPRRSAARDDLDKDFRHAPMSRATRSAQSDSVKRGRPRAGRSEPRVPSTSPPPPENASKNVKMMSMAERMRLKGKKIKITSRNPGDAKSGASKSASSAVSDRMEVRGPKKPGRPERRGEEHSGASSDDESASARSRLPMPVAVEKTVVKMGDVLSEADESEESGGSGDEIPARGVSFRGRGGVRGAFRGRGSGRGRGRARA